MFGLYILLMLSALKQANKKTITDILSSSRGTSLESISYLPKGYQRVDDKDGSVLVKTYLYQNFKEAFSHFILISKTCHGFNYYPQMFNVYNRIEIRLSTREGEGSRRQITSKDYYMALFLDEIHSKTAENAHEAAIDRIRTLV